MRSCLLVAALIFLCSACTPPPAIAQQPLDFVRAVDPLEVRDLDGSPYPYPFAGGFLQPRPQLVDLDDDGDADLVLSEGGRGLSYYENVGQGAPGLGFAWRTDALDEIVPGTWFRLGDLDGDEDLDLITQGAPSRVRYYRNTGSASNPVFTLAADELMQQGGVDPVMNEDTSIPALVDIDGDGDLDFLHGQADRGHITYYRNEGVSNGLPQFVFVTADFQDIEVFEANPTCEEPKPGELSGTGSRGSLHGANALTFVDLDDDNDYELFWGDFFARSLFYFRNDGTANTPDYTLVSEAFPLDEPLTSGGYNTPFFGDVDDDGDQDLAIGILGGLCSNVENKFDNLYFYRNIGNASNETYTLESERLIESVDVGERAVPILADLDADGDLDMVVGNDPLGLAGSQLVLFENQGSKSVAEFRITDPDWLSLEYDFGAYAPVFVDLDNDNDLDLIVGGFNGRLAFLRNTGSPTNATFVLEDEEFHNIDVGQYIRPDFGDVDGDGDFDLITGESNGQIKIYRNVGTPEVADFDTQENGSPVEADLNFRDAIGLGIDVGSDSAPRLVDIDGDNDIDMLTGTQEGPVRFFRNTGSATSPNYVEEEGIYAARPTTTPTFGDLDDDGDLDLIAGNRSGGLLFYSNGTFQVGVLAPPESPVDRAINMTVEPNPSSGGITFRFDRRIPTDAEVAVYDSRGRSVANISFAGDARSVEWSAMDISEIASGVYVARLVSDNQVLASAAFTRLR
ncbi:MAG: FG-GAP-like repeat-containing protein [Rubricoccaceae bacterium]|nr:FG-GAP-like repeat-containing protein [Rubricoccaceae bacterium]